MERTDSRREAAIRGFVCILRNGHPAADAPLTLDAFLSLSHLLVSPENERFGRVDAALARQDLKRRLALTLPQMYAAPLLIARSDMVATILTRVVAASGQSEGLSLLQPPVDLDPVTFLMAWHRRNDLHPGQRWFRESLAALSEGLALGPS